MHITHVVITVPDPDVTARFFRDVLEVRAEDHGNRTDLAIGASRLTLTPGEAEPGGYYHLAFDVPENAIAEARDLLRNRTKIFEAGDDGIVTTAPAWGGHSVYFNAPGNLNLELIARHRLPNAIDRPFTFADILTISEVSVPVASTADALRALHTTFGLEPFQEPTDTFAPVGTDAGLIIVVGEGRMWFPTEDQSTTARPLHIQLGGVRGHLTLGHAVISGEG